MRTRNGDDLAFRGSVTRLWIERHGVDDVVVNASEVSPSPAPS
jgi:hypothetical protein